MVSRRASAPRSALDGLGEEIARDTDRAWPSGLSAGAVTGPDHAPATRSSTGRTRCSASRILATRTTRPTPTSRGGSGCGGAGSPWPRRADLPRSIDPDHSDGWSVTLWAGNLLPFSRASTASRWKRAGDGVLPGAVAMQHRPHYLKARPAASGWRDV